MSEKQACCNMEGYNVEIENVIAKKSINILNVHCLEKIFKYLNIQERLQMEKVCVKWKEASQLAWNDITDLKISDDFIHQQYKMSTGVKFNLKIILKRCGCYLNSLELSNKFDSTIMRFVSENCKNLNKLTLKLNKYHKNDFLEAFSKMDKLQSITIQYLYEKKKHDYPYRAGYVDENEDSIEAKNVTEILKSFTKQIEEISFSFGPFDSFALSIDFSISLKEFSDLKYLELKRCRIDTNMMINITKIITLTHLNLEQSWLYGENQSLSNLINLEYLNLYETFGINDRTFIRIMNNCKKLRYLNIGKSFCVSKYALNELNKLNKLEEIMLAYSDVDDTIINQFQDLKSLNCASDKVTDKSIIKLIRKSPVLGYLNVENTLITIETLKYAADITKNRTNNVKLNLIADKEVVDEFNALNYINSPYLNIEYLLF